MVASVSHQLRKAGHHSVWATACQDKIAGGLAGVGVVSLGAVLLTFATSEFLEFFKLGGALRVTLGVVSLGGALLSLPYFITPSSVEGVFQVRSGSENHSSCWKRRSCSSFLFFTVIRERRRMLINFFLLISFSRLVLLKLG